MVYDKVQNLPAYEGICKNMSILIQYMREHDLNDLEDGKTVIDGDKVYLKIISGPAKPSNLQDYEVHKKYVDVHMVLEGTELYEVGLGEMTEVKPYFTEGDKEMSLVSGPVSGNGILDDERFVLFLPGEAHKTKVKAAGCDNVRHVLIKVLYEE